MFGSFAGNRGKADDAEIAEREQAGQPLRRHLRAADAGKTHARRALRR